MVHSLSLYSILTVVFVTKDLEVCRQHKARSDGKCIGKKAKSESGLDNRGII